MLDDISREFWHMFGVVLLICAKVGPIVGWYLVIATLG